MILDEDTKDRIQQAAARRYADHSFVPPGALGDLSRCVCCSDGNFRMPIAAEAFESARKERS